MKKIIKNLIVLFVLVLLLGFNVNAESIKTGEVELNEDYIRCIFNVKFENGINRKATLVSPSMEHYDFEYDKDKDCIVCSVQNVKKGKWKIAVTSELDDNVNIDNLSEEDIDNIGKFTINVEREEQLKKAVEDDIKIAKEIAGLKYYFKDDSIVIEWKDKEIGDVNITVTDSNTLKVLGKSTERNNFYQVPLDDSVKEIIVHIVPSQSEGIEGAETQFVLPFINNPDANILFDEFEYTNKPTLHAIASLKKSYSLVYEVNGEIKDVTDVLSIGDNDIEVPLSEGQNDIKVYVVDDKGNMRSTSTSTILDTVPPVLKIENDINGITTYDNNIMLNGIVEDYDFISFRNEQLEPDWEGNFSINAELKEGSNEIQIIASDRAGNEAIYTANVVMLVEQPKNINWTLIILLLALLIVTITIFLSIKKHGLPNISFKETKEKKPRSNNSNNYSSLLNLIRMMVLLLFIICLTRFLFRFGIVQSDSMDPKIKVGDITVENRLAYKFKDVERGDIITFVLPEYGNVILSKRVIGLPGDEISFVDGYVLVNGIVCDEKAYLSEDIETNCEKTFSVPVSSYFVLGDNRSNSYDSRYWKSPYITKEMIKGKLLFNSDIFSQLFSYINK